MIIDKMAISNKVQSINNVFSINKNFNRVNSNISDSFEIKNKYNLNNSISFTGKHYPSGYYEDSEIADAKRYIDEKGTEWQTKLYESSRKALNSKIVTTLEEDISKRILVDIFCLGIPELINLLVERKPQEYKNNKEAQKHVEKISKLIPDLIAEKLEKQEIVVDKKNAEALRQVEYQEQKQKIKEELTKKYIDLIDIDQKGKRTDMPNCIMLVGKSEDVPKELIEWTGNNSDCNFVKLANDDNDALQDSLWESLNKAEEKFKDTNKRTLIYVEGFDRLINPEINEFRNIEWLKSIMCSTTDDFHSTIIFSTKDPSKLNNEAIQPHRVSSIINVNIKSPEEELKEAPAKQAKVIEEIRNRLKNIDRVESDPLGTINDLIYLFASDEKKPLSPDYTPYELRKAEAVLNNHYRELKEEANKGLKKVLNLALVKLNEQIKQ